MEQRTPSMKRALLTLVTVVALVAGIWGYAYEFAYFAYFKLNVHETLTPRHFIYTGLINIGPMFGILLTYALVTKFFSKNVAQDDLKTVADRLASTKFSDEVILARSAFVLSLAFMLLVLFDMRLGTETGIGFMFWLFTFFNFQFFFGSLCLSPPQSRITVVFVFVLSVAMCFIAGGVDHARHPGASNGILRDDAVVRLHREGEKVIAQAKAIDIPISLLQKAFDWADKR